jgi:hypothetical protein
MVMQLVYTVLALYDGPLTFYEIVRVLPLSFWIFLGITPILLVVYQELAVKKTALTKFLRAQKRYKLEFNTKLGMHSPI